MVQIVLCYMIFLLLTITLLEIVLFEHISTIHPYIYKVIKYPMHILKTQISLH